MQLLYCELYLLALACALKLLKFDRTESCILLAANCVFLYWLVHTSVYYFAMDIRGHLSYVHYMTWNTMPPHPRYGWSFYHPPLYYLLIGKLKLLLNSIGYGSLENLRIASLLFYNSFLMIGMRTLRLGIASRSYYLIATYLLCFWPMGILVASEIDCHVLLYPAVAGSFYYLVRWHSNLQPRHLAASVAFAGLAVATRTNGYLMIPTIGLVALYHLYNRQVSMRAILRPCVIMACFVVLLGMAENSGRILYYRITDHTNQSLAVGNDNILMGRLRVRVPNVPAAFLQFDYGAYLAEPYIRPGRLASDSYIMWNELLKSASLSQFGFTSHKIAAALNSVMLVFWLVALLPILFYSRSQLVERLPHLALLFMCVVGSVYLRYSLPAYCSTHFRFVYFLTIPLTILFASNVQSFIRNRYTTLSYIGLGTAATLPVLAVICYIEQL